jgi:hypothetical protein
VESSLSAKKAREILDEKPTELALLAKKLCPAAKTEVNTRRYKDEDGRLKVFPPAYLSEPEVEALEEAADGEASRRIGHSSGSPSDG